MPVVIFFACLDLEQRSSFMDGHYLDENVHASKKHFFEMQPMAKGTVCQENIKPPTFPER
jgi:hypothetical protein